MDYEKVMSFFPLIDKNMYPSCQWNYIYEDDYIHKTKSNLVTSFREHNNEIHDSEPAKHLQNGHNHSFTALFVYCY